MMLDRDNHLWKPYKAASETLRGKRPLLFLSTPDHHLHLHGDLDDLDGDLDDHDGDLGIIRMAMMMIRKVNIMNR